MSATYLAHLARRFVTSLWPAPPPAADERWVADLLAPGEAALWGRMGGADRRHAVGVARRVQAALGDGATRPVLAAALLHDVGKTVSGFGPWRRSLATVLGAVAGRERVVARGGRAGAYLDHDRLGAQLLAEAGADPLTVAWAAEHHLPEDTWTVPAAVGRALKDADDD